MVAFVVKVKVNFTLQLVLKARGGGGNIIILWLYPFFNLGGRWGGWLPRAGRFTPEKVSQDPLYRRFGWPLAGLDGVKKFRLQQGSNTGPTSRYRVAILTAITIAGNLHYTIHKFLFVCAQFHTISYYAFLQYKRSTTFNLRVNMKPIQ
jgi:hypothetical protein